MEILNRKILSKYKREIVLFSFGIFISVLLVTNDISHDKYFNFH